MRLHKRSLILATVAALVSLIAGCGMGVVPVGTSIPDPLVEALPLTVAVVYDEEFAKYSYSEKTPGADVSIELGNSNTSMFDRVLTKAFATVVRRDAMPKDGEDLAGIDLVLKPDIDEYAFLTPTDAGVDFYSVSIRYRLAAFAPNGATLDQWEINSYGRTRAKMLSPKDSLSEATDLALRDAAATLALDFKQRPQIVALLHRESTDDKSSTSTQP